MQTTADIVAYGGDVRQRLAAWWGAKSDRSARETVQTYYGPQMLHEYLERSTWHVGQHVRQWIMLLGMAGIEADHPPAAPTSPNCRCPARCGTGNRGFGAGSVATRSAARPQAAAGAVPADAAGRMEPVEGAAFDVVDVRLHRALHDDGGGTRLRPGVRARAMARQRRLWRRDALSRARGGSDHRQCRAGFADQIDRADQHRPCAVRVASAASREVRRRDGPHQRRAVGHQRRHRLQAERVPHVRAGADRARPALRDGGRVHHDHGAAVDRG